MTEIGHRRETREEMGSVVVSVDAELAWGFHDLFPLSAEREQRMTQVRDRWKTLVDLFDQYDISATWAVVGQLLAKDPSQYHEQHPISEEWFETAQENYKHNPEWWRGTELIRTIEAADANHEIGSHSFSHVVFSEVPEEIALAESRFSKQIGVDNGIDFISFVFPRNKIDHEHVLSETGFTCYRGERPNTTPQLPGLQGMAMLGRYITGQAQPPPVKPTIDEHGLVNIPASMYLGGFRDWPWSTLAAIHSDPGARLAKLGINRACEETKLFHLWLHPNDLTDRRYIKRLRDVFSHISTKRQRGELRVETMGEIADRIKARGD